MQKVSEEEDTDESVQERVAAPIPAGRGRGRGRGASSGGRSALGEVCTVIAWMVHIEDYSVHAWVSCSRAFSTLYIISVHDQLTSCALVLRLWREARPTPQAPYSREKWQLLLSSAASTTAASSSDRSMGSQETRSKARHTFIEGNTPFDAEAGGFKPRIRGCLAAWSSATAVASWCFIFIGREKDRHDARWCGEFMRKRDAMVISRSPIDVFSLIEVGGWVFFRRWIGRRVPVSSSDSPSWAEPVFKLAAVGDSRRRLWKGREGGKNLVQQSCSSAECGTW